MLDRIARVGVAQQKLSILNVLLATCFPFYFTAFLLSLRLWIEDSLLDSFDS